MQRRRVLIASLVLPWALLRSAGTEAQTPDKVIVIGILDAGNRSEWWDVFRKRLSELGYVEGRNVKFELRAASGDLDRLPGMAKDLVQLKVALIVTAGVAAASAAQRATNRIPIIMASGTDQVSMGLVTSLAQPGRNVTGVSSLNSELATKRFELLRELVPKSSRLGVLWHADNPASNPSVRDLEGAATRARVAFKSFGVRTADEFDDAFAAMTRERIDAIFVVNSPFIYEKRKQIVDLANKYRIPAIYGAAEFVDAGGLVSYAPSYPEMFRHAADYVDKVLRGANPGTLPIEQPTKIELVLNASAAKGLGLVVPTAILARADRVVQ